MKWAFVLMLQLQAICALAVEAPRDWKQVQGEKEFTGQALPLRQLGVWRSSNGDVVVQVLEMKAIKDGQGVWNVVGGSVSGLTKADLAPSSSRIVGDTPHVAFCLSGKGKQEGGATGPLDNYFVFGESSTYMVKVFSTTSTSDFVLADWDFGTPIRENREALAQALSQIKDRLDRGVSLMKSSPTPSENREEEFESAKNASDDELRGDLGVWTSVIDHTKERAINAAKRQGKPPPTDMDAELRGMYRRLANNKFFNLDREERIHPGYQHELAQIAALRGEKYVGGSATYQLAYFGARYGLSLGLLVFLISRWTRRVSRRTDVRSGQSRSGYYGKLLLKMSWRVALLIVLSLGLVFLSHVRPGLSDKELQNALAITFFFLFVVVPAAYLITSWSHTKRRFAMQPVIANGGEVAIARTQKATTSVAKALDGMSSSSPTSRVEVGTGEANKPTDTGLNKRADSSWWKRLFTVIEIAVLLASVGIVLLLLREVTSGALATILLGPVALAHLLRVAIIYIVDEKKPFSRRD